MRNTELDSELLLHKHYHTPVTIIIIPAFLFLIAGFIFLFFGRMDIYVKAQGKIMPSKIVQKIQMNNTEDIVENDLSEGKKVHEGETLIVFNSYKNNLASSTITTQKEYLTQKMEILKRYEESVIHNENHLNMDDFGYQSLFEEYQQQRAMIHQQLMRENQDIQNKNDAVQKTQSTLMSQVGKVEEELKELHQQLENSENLASDEKNTTTQSSSENQQTLQDIRQKLDQKEQEKYSLQLQLDNMVVSSQNTTEAAQLEQLKSQKIAKIRQEKSDLEQQIKQMDEQEKLQEYQQSYDKIVANQAGILHINESYVGMKNIPVGSVVAEIYPLLEKEETVLIETYVDSRTISSIYEGQTVYFESNPNQTKSVRAEGTIKTIGISPELYEDNSLYKVIVNADISEDIRPILKYGLQGNVHIITGNKTFLEYLLDKMIYGEEF